MVWWVAILFLFITILLLSGKGAFLIAGYNTASAAVKQKYDEKKLCHVMGCGMGVITAFLFALACFGVRPPNRMLIALPVVIVTVTAAMLILCNTVCKAKDAAPAQAAAANDMHSRRVVKASLLFTAVLFLIIGALLFTGEIETVIDEKSITIDSSDWKDYTVPLDHITSVSLVKDLGVGRRTFGLGSFRLSEGNFRNNAFGDYILYAYLSCDSYVVLETTDGIVAPNAETAEETDALYQTLKQAVDSYSVFS